MVMLNKSLLDNQFIIVTLTELTTITDPYYLFVFKHIETNNEFKIIYYVEEDQSNFKYRFNEFVINKSSFDEWNEGDYLYDVYEQESNSDLTTDNKNKVESGKMILLSDGRFDFVKYNSQTNFKAYDGQ